MGQPDMAMPAHDSPAWNPTQHTRAMSTMRLLKQVQHRVVPNYSVRSMAERRGALTFAIRASAPAAPKVANCFNLVTPYPHLF